MRVVDLHDDHPKLAARVAAQVERGRVELVAEDAQVRHAGQAPALGVEALVAQVLPHRGLEVPRRGVEVIAVPEAKDARPVAPDKTDPARDLVELREVEGEVEDAVVEPVREWAGPEVGDPALEKMRPHATICPAAAARSSAAS